MDFMYVLLYSIDEFVRDFDYRDIMDKKRLSDLPGLFNLLSQEQFPSSLPEEVCIYTEMLKLQTMLRWKIFLLFWFITRKNNEKYVKIFLKVIEKQYKWLTDKVENQAINDDLIRFIQLMKQMRNDDQKHAEYNVRRIKPFMELYDKLLKMKNFDIIVLYGDLGIGKKWLVRDVCQTYGITKAMNFQIYWLDVGNCINEAEDVRMLNRLSILIENRFQNCLYPQDNSDIQNTKVKIQQYLKEKFRMPPYRDCLLILANVQNTKTMKTFNLGCKVLAITRNKKINGNEHITMDTQLTEMEFKLLFKIYIKDTKEKINHSIAKEIYIKSSGHPYLLNIIGQSLRQDKTLKNCQQWIQDLTSFSVPRDAKLERAVKSSLRPLSANTDKLFKKLCIFPPNVPIPVKLLELVWEERPNKIIEELSDRSILTESIDQDGKFVVSIPIVYRMTLSTDETLKASIDPVAYHKMIIDYYKVDDLVSQLRDHTCHLQHDLYFYNNIVYHLQKAGREDLIMQLYRTFEYLEQKFRAIGLLNTLVDINDILKNKNIDQHNRKFLKSLLIFLPKIEEKILHSNDSCLLQCALMDTGLIREEAEQQIKIFRDRVWFTDKSSFRQTRQIVSLPQNALIVKLLDPDVCLVVTDRYMSLLHTSTKDNPGAKILIEFNEDNDRIRDVHIRDNGNYIVALDGAGVLKIWHISSNVGKHSLHIVSNIKDYITAIYIEEESLNLHVALKNGDINLYEWNATDHTHKRSAVTLKTNEESIKFLTKVCGKYYMVINTNGQIYFWNTIDYSQINHKILLEDIIYYKMLKSSNETCANIILVSNKRVYSLKLENYSDVPRITYPKMYECDTIVCAALSPDERYLILGQERTCLIFDMETKTISLRRNVSDEIASIDVTTLHDKVFKYVIVCSVKLKNVLHLYGLRKDSDNTIAWAHELTKNDDDEEDIIPQLEPFVSLLGEKLYDMRYNGGIFLVAVDSKNRIHQICTNGRKESSIPLPENSNSITAITTNKEYTFFGCKNGEIYDINKKIVFEKFSKGAINYLHLVNTQILIAADATGKMLIYNLNNGKTVIYNFQVKKTYELTSDYLIFINVEMQVLIVDVVKGLVHGPSNQLNKLKSSAFQCSYLYLASESKVYVYDCNINIAKKKPIISEINVRQALTKVERDAKFCCLAVDDACNLMALGCDNGLIMLFQLINKNKQITLIGNLKSHVNPICDMKFSPNAEVLVSCVESFCFWNVTYILNNPCSPAKISTRFTSQSSIETEEVDAQLITNSENYSENSTPTNSAYDNLQKKAYTWSNKRGPHDNPALFACLKFDGNKAEQFFANAAFTQFNTIDNEGVFYQYNPFNASEPEMSLRQSFDSLDLSADGPSNSTEDLYHHTGSDIPD